MEKISLKAYQLLIEGADVIEKDGFGIKVLDTKKGEMIKLFRRKRFFSTALFKPYAARFANNAERLTRMNIPTIIVTRLLWCADIKRHIVIYKRLEGELLREVLANQTAHVEAIYQKFAAFIAELHEKGVYFRSAHLKNILLLPNGEFGLIDISDMQIKRGPLSLVLRERNFSHILQHQEDKDLIGSHYQAFVSSYFKKSQLKEPQRSRLDQSIRSILA
ncbi:MAG: lipopolysaccharide kinase InaA family protein [Cycloclasticus sp.]